MGAARARALWLWCAALCTREGEEKDKEKQAFSVIVVDTCPSFSGRDVAQRLSHNGIHCKYTLI